MVHNMVQDGEALRTENGRCKTVIKELWADMQSMKLGTILAIARARSMRQSLIALWKSGIGMHGYEASFSHRG